MFAYSANHFALVVFCAAPPPGRGLRHPHPLFPPGTLHRGWPYQPSPTPGRHVLCHLLGQVVADEDERAQAADAIRSVITTTGILWAPMDAPPERGGASHDVALRFAGGQPVGRTVELRTPRLHEDD